MLVRDSLAAGRFVFWPRFGQNDEVTFTPLQHPGEIGPYARRCFSQAPIRLAISGHTDSTAQYDAITQDVLGALVLKLGRVGLVTSPTTKGIDGIGTRLALENQLPLLYVTAKNYTGSAKVQRLPEALRQRFLAIPKFTFPDVLAYSQAGALASNALIVVGGGGLTVTDAVHAIQAGNPVIVWDDDRFTEPVWDAVKNRPANASRYLAAQVEAVLQGQQKLPYPEYFGLTRAFLEAHRQDLATRVHRIRIQSPAQVPMQIEHVATLLQPQAARR